LHCTVFDLEIILVQNEGENQLLYSLYADTKRTVYEQIWREFAEIRDKQGFDFLIEQTADEKTD
jgi:hypothetical protein